GIRDRNVTGVQTCALPISQNQTEENNHKLLNDIRRITELPSLGMNDHLFDFGIDSLSVVELEIYLESVFSTTLPSGYLYLHPTRSEERRVGKECRSWWYGW